MTNREQVIIEIITDIVNTCHKIQANGLPKTGRTKILREAIYFLWEIRDVPKHGAARIRSQQAREQATRLIYDHPIPMSLIQDKLMSKNPATPEHVEAILKKYNNDGGVLITKAEDELLNAKGLNQRMPDDWDEDKGDMHARYEEAGIKLHEA